MSTQKDVSFLTRATFLVSAPTHWFFTIVLAHITGLWIRHLVHMEGQSFMFPSDSHAQEVYDDQFRMRASVLMLRREVETFQWEETLSPTGSPSYGCQAPSNLTP